MDKLKRIEHIYRSYIFLFIKIGSQYRLNQDMIEEIVQDSFVEAIHTQEQIRLDTESGIRGYIIRIFRNKCIDHIRMNFKCNGCRFDFEAALGIVDAKEDPLHELLLREELRLRDYAVTQITPEKYKEPVQLFLEGEKPVDIAGIIDKNRSTTRNLIQRGLMIFETIMLNLDPLREK